MRHNYATIKAKGDEKMPRIIPIRELRDTNAISEICHSSEEPVFITKNGYGDMVIMSLETFEKNSGMSDFYGNIKFNKEKRRHLISGCVLSIAGNSRFKIVGAIMKGQ